MRKILIIVLLLLSSRAHSQCTFQHQWTENYPSTLSPLTPVMDELGRPYVYVASNELGLRIYKINGAAPVLITTLDTNDLQMRVMSVSQYDTLLYVCIGSSFPNSNDPPGIVIVSVGDPENPQVLGSWIHPLSGSGCGIVKVEGDYAYVGGMTLGLFILNIANPNNIAYVSNYPLDINFPYANPSNPGLYNARGMEVKNGIVYLCFDAGGLRIINCINPNNPVQTGRFANPITYPPVSIWNMPRAYNNIVLNDTLAYVAVDYCGVEILDISDTSDIQLLAHYNPHDCPNGTWWTSPVHANELEYVANCQKLFVSSGVSELLALDVSDPFTPVSCGGYGSTTDTTATWGLDYRNDTIILTYVFSVYIPPVTPFQGINPGLRMVTWTDPCTIGVAEESVSSDGIRIFPNPVSVQGDGLTIKWDNIDQKIQLSVYNLTGQLVFEKCAEGNEALLIQPSHFAPGMYEVVIRAGDEEFSQSLVITP